MSPAPCSHEADSSVTVSCPILLPHPPPLVSIGVPHLMTTLLVGKEERSGQKDTGLAVYSNRKNRTHQGIKEWCVSLPGGEMHPSVPMLFTSLPPSLPTSLRWGHSGYKEIYAEEFASSESENGDNERTSHKGKQRGRHKKNKVKSETLGSDGTHRRKRKRRHDSSGSEPSSDEERRRRRLKRKKKRDMRKKENRKRSPSTSDTK